MGLRSTAPGARREPLAELAPCGGGCTSNKDPRLAGYRIQPPDVRTYISNPNQDVMITTKTMMVKHQVWPCGRTLCRSLTAGAASNNSLRLINLSTRNFPGS